MMAVRRNGHFDTSPMALFYHPVFRNVVIFLAVVMLMVFCFDKSRQNRRTRNALYNCVYPLYAAAVAKAGQVIDSILGVSVMSEALSLAVVALSVFGYAKWMRRKADIPYNNLFYYCGWLFLAVVALIQLGFLFLALSKQPQA